MRVLAVIILLVLMFAVGTAFAWCLDEDASRKYFNTEDLD